MDRDSMGKVAVARQREGGIGIEPARAVLGQERMIDDGDAG